MSTGLESDQHLEGVAYTNAPALKTRGIQDLISTGMKSANMSIYTIKFADQEARYTSFQVSSLLAGRFTLYQHTEYLKLLSQ